MERNPTLIADALAAAYPDEPTAEQLVAYARDAAALPSDLRAQVADYLAASASHRDRFRALAPPDWRLAGSCLCGAVHYKVKGPLHAIGHCHCRRCRKGHAAAFGTFARIDPSALSWTSGAELLSRYGGHGDPERTFCQRCGSTLVVAQGAWLALSVATLDVDPIARPTLHVAVARRAPWFEIHDDLPQQSEPLIETPRT